MKKQHLLIALGLLVLSSCNNTNTPSNGSESNNSTSQLPSIIDSSSPSTSNSSNNSISASPSTSNDSSSSTTAPSPAIKTVESIKDIFTLGENVKENEIGDLVQFEATYLRGIAMTRSSEDLMLFADEESYIYLRLSYAKYTGYLANRYVMQEYQVTANITKVNNQIELTLNDSLTTQESVINLSSSTSYNQEQVSEVKSALGN